MGIERKRVRCDEVGHRRGFLVASAALGAALLLPGIASAAQVKVLQGAVRVNGKRATKATPIRPGDTVEAAKGARVVFVIGDDAFLLRGDSKLMLEHTSGAKALVITGLRLLSGGLLAAFAPGARRIETPTATAGIRGTAIYVEASREQTYFCTCYGVVELRDKAGVERKTVISGYHTPNMIYANPTERGKMEAVEVKDHTDEELIMLERLVGRTSPIVLRNQKLKDASQPDEVVPAKPAPEQKAQPEQKAPAEQKPAEQSSAPKRDIPDEQPAPNKSTQPAQKEMPSPPAEDVPPPEKKSSSKKKKQSKSKLKPEPETPPPPPAEKAPEVQTPSELGPSPTPPQPPQPPAQEWRLPPPRLDQ
jgi:hypothetical protein